MSNAIAGTKPFTPKELKAARKAYKRSRPKSSRRRGPCVHLGEAILLGQAAELGLDTRRTWKPCALGRGEKGHVCNCKPGASCRGCPDYSPATVYDSGP